MPRSGGKFFSVPQQRPSFYRRSRVSASAMRRRQPGAKKTSPKTTTIFASSNRFARRIDAVFPAARAVQRRHFREQTEDAARFGQLHAGHGTQRRAGEIAAARGENEPRRQSAKKNRENFKTGRLLIVVPRRRVRRFLARACWAGGGPTGGAARRGRCGSPARPCAPGLRANAGTTAAWCMAPP